MSFHSQAAARPMPGLAGAERGMVCMTPDPDTLLVLTSKHLGTVTGDCCQTNWLMIGDYVVMLPGIF